VKRLKLSEDEVAIIEGLRQEKAIWNKALETALRAALEEPNLFASDANVDILTQRILELRK
jgi:hypothetical protein